MRGHESIPQDGILRAPTWALVMMRNEALLLGCLLFACPICKYQLLLEHVMKTNDLCWPGHKETGQIRMNERDRRSPHCSTSVLSICLTKPCLCRSVHSPFNGGPSLLGCHHKGNPCSFLLWPVTVGSHHMWQRLSSCYDAILFIYFFHLFLLVGG